LRPGLPDGIFTKNPDVGKVWRVLQWKMLVYVLHIWPFGLLYGNLVYFSRFGMLYVARKIWQPCLRPVLKPEV
jgi:hypothetical protein